MLHAPTLLTRSSAPMLWALGLVALMAGCASSPPGGIGTTPARAVPPLSDRDGPHPHPPPDLDRVPDAEPRVEVLRAGGPNKPYEVLGQRYTPIATDTKVIERGLASWYGRKFHGRPTASGEPYDMHAMTAAHPRLPIPSYAVVRNPANGREVVVRINDRGPFHPGRIIDLSYTAALKLGVLRGVSMVEVERLTNDEIRSGRWRLDGGAVAANRPDDAMGEPRRREATDASKPSADVTAGATANGPAPGDPAVAATTAAEVAGAPPDPRAATEAVPVTPAPAESGFWVQLGAFRERASALSLQQRVMQDLSSLAPGIAVFTGRGTAPHRLQAGPYRSRDEASRAARQLGRLLGLAPQVVERR